MSNSSTTSDLEKEIGFDKETGFEKETGQTHLTEGQEDLIEASEPNFTERDVERTAEGDGASLSRVASEKPSVNNIKSVPNGGLQAWMQVISSFFVFFNTWGIVNAVCHS